MVVEGQARRNRAAPHEVPVGAAAAWVLRVVDAVATPEQTEAGALFRSSRSPGDAHLEPAHRAGAVATEDDPGGVGVTHNRVDAVLPPERQQVDHAAAADVDQILTQQMLADIDPGLAEAKERQDRGLHPPPVHRGMEGGDLRLRVAAGGRQVTNPGTLGSAEIEHVVVDRVVLGSHRELDSAYGDDCRHRGHDRISLRRGGMPVVHPPGRSAANRLGTLAAEKAHRERVLGDLLAAVADAPGGS